MNNHFQIKDDMKKQPIKKGISLNLDTPEGMNK